ncbi:MAG: hypothetical protein IPN71_16220 [Fibrobacteres bacterium]|nr:hypothetical protein [Fibrobacterota bacterium]
MDSSIVQIPCDVRIPRLGRADLVCREGSRPGQSLYWLQALEAKLDMELERTGRAKRASMADPATNFEATWTAAKASGASKFLYTTLRVKSDGLREASS